jgi:NAD(P)-dependent dehydrogenase (short-subunit alcohol dehydrogenase family)
VRIFWNFFIQIDESDSENLGMVYTPMMYGVKGSMSEQEREARKARSLLKTEGNGWDVGSAVRFLASDLSRWMTGTKTPSREPGS